MTKQKHALVIGGSGFIGTAICNQLAEAGYRITVPTRRYKNAKHLLTIPTCQVIQANVHDRAALSRLVDGKDVVINLLGILYSKPGKPYGQAFRQNHVELPKALCAVMKSKRVKRLVHISALGVGAKNPAPSQYLRSKTDGEAAVKDSGLAWTILRPSVVFGRTDNFLNMFATFSKLAPLFPLAGANTKFQPVSVMDVAKAVRMSLTTLENQSIHHTYDLAGPEVFTLSELVKLCAHAIGKDPLIVPLPTPLGKLQAFFLECLPGQPLMSRDNVDSMSIDNVSSTGKLFPLDRYVSLSAYAPEYLKDRFNKSDLDDFRQKAHRRG